AFPSFGPMRATLASVRLGVLFVLRRRSWRATPRWGRIATVVGIEVVLGITGFFAAYREQVVLAALAVLEVFDRRNRQHWIEVVTSGVVAVMLGLVWMGIRTQYRREFVELDQFANSRSARIDRVRDLASAFMNADSSDVWNTADVLVERLWAIYYPALALERVPKVIAHTDGEIFGAALRHIVTPRI